jgi:hypothetical protein
LSDFRFQKLKLKAFNVATAVVLVTNIANFTRLWFGMKATNVYQANSYPTHIILGLNYRFNVVILFRGINIVYSENHATLEKYTSFLEYDKRVLLLFPTSLLPPPLS